MDQNPPLWTFTPSGNNQEQNQQPNQALGTSEAEGGIAWEADEFVAHPKSTSWYGYLTGGAVGLSAVLYLITRDVIPVIVVLIMAGMFGFLAARKPRRIVYRIDQRGFTIGDRHYPLSIFRSFSLQNEGQIDQSIWLMPLKRFVPVISIYFEDENKKEIVETLLSMMPYEEHSPDIVDRIMQRIHY